MKKLKWLINMRPLHRNLAGGGVVLLAAILAGNFMIRPRVNQISGLKNDLNQLNSEVTVYRAKVKKLDELIEENKRLQGLLEQQKRQLPEQHEVEDLLKQITDAGARAGLIFKLWRPGQPVLDQSGLYQSLPVDVDVAGSYHQVGVFFENVAHLDRIVNISNINMSGGAKAVGDVLSTRFQAVAFASPPKVPEGTDAAPEKGKK